MVSRTQRLSVSWIRSSVVIRFATVLYPVDILGLWRRLPEVGFIVPRTPEEGETVEPKDLPSKGGEIRLAFNPDAKTLGVVGVDPRKVAQNYEELMSFWRDQFDPGPGSSAEYVEVNASGWVQGQASTGHAATAADKIAHWWNKQASSGLAEMTSVLRKYVPQAEAPLVQHGLRLVTPGGHPNSPEWGEFAINQFNPSANRYHVQIIWRAADEHAVISVARTLDELIPALLARIEST